MNIRGLTIQPFLSYWFQFNKETEPVVSETQIQEENSISETTPSTKINKIKPEELVMKPSPVSFEERMNQVISPEQMKNLLSMMTRSRMSENLNDHKIDIRR
ncbi:MULTISPECIES: hypothetical protein [Leptospira]|uniref:Uncharacterized protein n=4 Tax=Leptospira kirschneri TaxID=29507 RepID=A0A1T1DPA4_9LEPT|nr:MULTISPECIES: hypothetical protein [Leptospira]EMO74555.1 hypothetical protein LEP1GSC127_0769 [Leptospira kirschneri str. 200801925]EJO70363.1 hypothetical protein LEP1GSC044_2276 [Leptospira kirschneri serovar Grippotyphosa str. RM52]EKO14987.1 hypothetical protein LEP1GSC081_1650 [Leptospira kirschneri str. H1]EKO51063.1 hypothetical protein LEP1GSC131_2340 [Leptospira kirschneri str. 200802841]EKO61096.1 hypothetical protein LEP1GSC082_2806 [Leptospira kirschneri str. H2]